MPNPNRKPAMNPGGFDFLALWEYFRGSIILTKRGFAMQLVKFDRASNGMMCYSQVSSAAHMGGVGVKAGSVNDPPGKRGLAHLTEHILFGGYDEESDRDVGLNYYEKYMGGPDAFAKVETGFVYTFYGADQLLWRPHVLDWFDRMSKLLSERRVTSIATAREKAAVHNEYFMRGNDDLVGMLGIYLRQLIYQSNPVVNRIDCELPEFESVTAADVRNFIRKWYVPKNMFAILFGPPLAEVKKRVEKNFSNLTSLAEPKLEFKPADCAPALVGVKTRTIISPKTSQHHFVLGFPTETFATRDAEAIDVLSRILSFRLRTRLRHDNQDFRKGVYRAFATADRTYLHGLISIWFATVGNFEYLMMAEKMVLEEVERLKVGLVSADELDAMKKNMEWQYRAIFRDAPGFLADQVVAHVANGDEELLGLHSFLPNMAKVTRKRIREVANKYFTSNFARIIVQPQQ